MSSSPFTLKLPGGKQISFSNQQEAQSFFERLSLSQRLGQVLSPDAVSVMQAHSQEMRQQVNKIPQQMADLEKIVSQGKSDATLGQFGSVLDGAMSWVDTASEGAKLSPNFAAQAVARTWLASTQGTKAIIGAIQGKPGDASENALGALSQIPGMGLLDDGKKAVSAFNSGYEGAESLHAGNPDIAIAKVTKGMAEAIKNPLAGSAVQSMANTYVKKQEFSEMSDLKNSMDKTLEIGRNNYEKLGDHLTQQANTNDVYAALANRGRDPETAQMLEAFKQQMPEVVQQSKDGKLDALLSSATDVARQNATKAYRKEAPDKLSDFEARQQEIDRSPPAAAPLPSSSPEKTQYWFDPKDKDGFVNVRDPDGIYRRVPLEQAVEKGWVPPGTTTGQMTQYDVKEDKFLNDLNTSDRDVSRADRIANTEYPDAMTMPAGGSARQGSSAPSASETSSPVTPPGKADDYSIAAPKDSSSTSPSALQDAGLRSSAEPQAVAQDVAGGQTLNTASESASKGGANWFNPGGGGGIIKDGPTYENWGGGGWSGGVRDPTPVCRIDWQLPKSKMDEAFRDHDYDYMRDGIDANTPQSNPLKQAADLRLLEKLKQVPDSELDANSLLFKTTTQLFFGEKTSGKYDPELVEKLKNIPLSDLDWEERAAKLMAEGKIQKDELGQFFGDMYESTKQKLGDAADYLGNKAGEAEQWVEKEADELGDKLSDAADLAKRKAEELGKDLSEEYDSLKDRLNSLVNPSGKDDAPAWEGSGGSFGGGGASGSWDSPKGDVRVLSDFIGTEGGAAGDADGKSITAIDTEAEALDQATEGHAKRAESAAQRAVAAAQRAAAARAQIQALLSGI
jgi:hypothetical protein